MTQPQGHSPLGASGAKRWMACPGSVSLSQGIVDPESDHAAEGTAAHAVADYCHNTGDDAWTMIGYRITPDGKMYPPKAKGYAEANDFVEVTKDMADAVQVYLDWGRTTFPKTERTLVEHRFHCPSIHELFYGTVDRADECGDTLYVTDYKHGAGIVVEAEENPQGMYYACGFLEHFKLWSKIDKIVITIVQPRGFHRDGPIRSWTITTEDLQVWLEDKLIPAMQNALVSRETKSGEHCRFCPVRSHACPQLLKDVEEFQAMSEKIGDGKGAAQLTGEQLSRYLELGNQIKIAFKAAQTTAFHRLSAGGKVPGFKLVAGKTNREFKEGAEAAAKEEFGDAAYSKPALLSPAQIDALPLGKKFTERWAEKPPGALQVAPIDDARTGVSKDNKSAFKAVAKKRK